MNKLYKKVISIVLAVVITAGTAAALPSRAQAAGPSTNTKTKIAIGGLSLIDTLVVMGLDYAADKTGNNMFTTAANLVAMIPVVGDKNRSVSNQCKEIIQKLDELSKDVYNMNTNIQESLAELAVSADKESLSVRRSNISEIAAECNKIVSEYKNYLKDVAIYDDMVEKYGATPTEAQKNEMAEQKTVLEGRLAMFVKAAENYDFDKAIRTIAKNSCRVYPAYGSESRTPTNTLTDVYYAAKLSDESFAFQHQKYNFVVQEMNITAAAFTSVSQAHRLWADYLESINKLKGLQQTRLDETLEEVTQGINDLMAQAETYVGSLMRPYDVDTSVEMDYKESIKYHYSRSVVLGQSGSTVYATGEVMLSADKTAPVMEFYRVVPIGDIVPWLVLKNSANGPSNTKDWVTQVPLYEKKTKYVGTVDALSADFQNMRFSSFNSPNLYLMPDSAVKFNGIISRKAFSLAGGNFIKYLKENGGLDDVSGKATVVPLLAAKDASDRNSFTHSDESEYDVVELSKYNIDNPKKFQKTRLSGNGMFTSLNSEEMIVVLSGSLPQIGSIKTEGATSADTVTVTPDPRYKMKDGMGYGAGTMLTVNFSTTRTITAEDGSKKKAAGLALADTKGNVLQVLVEPDNYSFLENNGKIQFSFPMPYQNCILKVLSPTEPVPESANNQNSLDSIAPDAFDSGHSFNLTETENAAEFTDINDHPAKDDIELLASLGLVAGTGGGKFLPDEPMTRAMFVTALGRLSGADMSAYVSSNFSDVSIKSPYRPYAEWAYKSGIAQGHGNWSFKPDEPVTREQMAVFTMKFAEKTGIEMPASIGDSGPYNDHESISEWATDAVYAIRPSGIMKEDEGFLFNPKRAVTKAEGASMLARLIRAIRNS